MPDLNAETQRPQRNAEGNDAKSTQALHENQISSLIIAQKKLFRFFWTGNAKLFSSWFPSPSLCVLCLSALNLNPGKMKNSFSSLGRAIPSCSSLGFPL